MASVLGTLKIGTPSQHFSSFNVQSSHSEARGPCQLPMLAALFPLSRELLGELYRILVCQQTNSRQLTLASSILPLARAGLQLCHSNEAGLR